MYRGVLQKYHSSYKGSIVPSVDFGWDDHFHLLLQGRGTVGLVMIQLDYVYVVATISHCIGIVGAAHLLVS